MSKSLQSVGAASQARNQAQSAYQSAAAVESILDDIDVVLGVAKGPLSGLGQMTALVNAARALTTTAQEDLHRALNILNEMKEADQ
ncbi:MAG: hypothetical protein AAGC91_01135 [Pseudomonadota bacterium]